MNLKNLSSPMAVSQAGPKFLGATSFFLILLLLVVQAKAGPRPIKVVASIFPAYDFARIVGGERLEIRQLLPPGVEAHGFSPTPRDIIRLNKADLFFYTGAIMEPRMAKLLHSLDGTVKVVDLSAGLVDHEGHDHHGDHADPHFWLDPIRAVAMVKHIATALIDVDPDHAEEYQQRAEAYCQKLMALDADIRAALAHCQRHTIISGGHFAFGYFIKRYGLQAISAYPGFSPDAKPSPKGIAALIAAMKETGATAVYHEELLNPKVARILVEETGAQLLLLHGAHNITKRERAEGVTYLTIMQDNVRRLGVGLSCQ